MTTMLACAIDQHGGPEALRIQRLPQPVPGPHELRVRVHASSVNPADLRARRPSPERTVARHFPLVLGYDFSGLVDQLGSEVQGFQVGDEVFGCPNLLGQGAHAEWVTVDARVVAHKPRALTHAQAGVAPLVCLTAHGALLERARLVAGETVLIHAAAGGVGHVALQLAKLHGCHVIATTRRAGAGAHCRALGADDVICEDEDFVEVMRARGQLADVVLDTLGGQQLARSVAVTAPYGRIVTIVPGAFAGAEQLAFLRCISISYELMGARLIHSRAPERLGQALATLAPILASGQLRVHTAASYPISQLAAAHTRLERGGFEGKLAVEVLHGWDSAERAGGR